MSDAIRSVSPSVAGQALAGYVSAQWRRNVTRSARDRFANTVDSQVRIWNTFCSIWIPSRTAPAFGNGPKKLLRFSSLPRWKRNCGDSSDRER